MKISTSDQSCRYMPALGTQVESLSPFGAFLRKNGVVLPADCSLERIVAKRWVQPVLRVILPRAAFDSWRNYPGLSMDGCNDCRQEDYWALNLYIKTMNGSWPRQDNNWWFHFLDDPVDDLTRAAMAAQADPQDPALLPPIFRHARANQEIRPWLDFFAYWQIFPIVEFLHAMTKEMCVTDNMAEDLNRVVPLVKRMAETRAQTLVAKWERRKVTFDWLSRMRTVLGGSIQPERSWNEITTALRNVANSLALTTEQMKTGIRDTLLVMWSEWTRQQSPLTRNQDALLELLRQEIEYAILYVELLSGQPTDFLEPYWYDRRQIREWSNLINALPLEEELAKRDFARTAAMYLREHNAAVPQAHALREQQVQQQLERWWDHNPPLHRFSLALFRLHKELAGPQLTAREDVIRKSERIEQFLLLILHSEKILSLIWRNLNPNANYPDVRQLARDRLNTVLGRFGLTKRGIGQVAMQNARQLLDQRAQLHNLNPQQGLGLVTVQEVQSGCNAADHLVAAFVNFVIARNYAAHHDALDSDLINPGNGNPNQHPGHLVVSSVLVAVLTTMQTANP